MADHFTTVTSHAVSILIDDIDTDQIIPAEFLKVTSRAGLGDHLFSNWRYDTAGQPHPDFVLNRTASHGSNILVSGINFGCGSSREHAPWALVDWGFRVVIARSFADIFYNNAIKNRLLPVALEPETHRALVQLLEAEPTATLIVDLAAQRLSGPDGFSTPFAIDAFDKRCLAEGISELDYLLGAAADVVAYEEKRFGQSPPKGVVNR
ncbi:MAG: 3-isopropylmalate dehydratase small subunit [Myxococcota bacterium]